MAKALSEGSIFPLFETLPWSRVLKREAYRRECAGGQRRSDRKVGREEESPQKPVLLLL